MARTGVALGSNLGDRLHNLRSARARLLALSPDPGSLLQAAVYETAPLLCPEGSPSFLNTVIELELDGPPHELLAAARRIERELGRSPSAVRNAPRVIDVDLLYSGGFRCSTPELTLPHPRLAQRSFVLRPLADIRPELIPPGFAESVAELLKNHDAEEEPPQLFAPEW